MLVLLAACTPNRASAVDGTAFPIASSGLASAPGAFGDDDLLVVTLSSLPDTCGAQAAFRAASDGESDPDALAAAWAAAYPATFTEIVIGARVAGATWPPPHTAWPGLAWDGFPEEAGVVFATWVAHRAHRDADWFAGIGEADAVETTWLSHEGLLKWGAGLPSQRLVGHLVTTAATEDGASVGTAEVRFDAVACPP